MRVKTHLGEDERAPAVQIQGRLGREAEGSEELTRIRDRIPSERTIERIRKEWRNDMTEAQRREYRPVCWPESFGIDDLPWEAGVAVLELIRHVDTVGERRPAVRVAKWFWRVTQAIPGTPLLERLSVALALASNEAMGCSPVVGIESLLVNQPKPRLGSRSAGWEFVYD